MRFWRIEICHITDIYEKQKDYSVLKNEEKYMIEKVYDDNMLSFKEKGLYTAIYLNETMNVDQLVESGKDKADAVRSGLKKLIEKQYITINEQISNFAQTYPTNLKASSNEALLFMRRYRFANCSCFSCCFKDAYPSSNVQ